MQETFNMMVLEHFPYLVSEYNFRVDKDLQNDTDFPLEGLVEYLSPSTFVSIVGGWFDVEVSFGRVVDDRRFAISANLVHEFLSLTLEQRQIVCSLNPRDKKEAKQLIANGFEQTEQEVIDHAFWIRQYADPFLRGDFSLWLPIHEYRLARMIGEVRQSWKREVSWRDVGMTEDRKLICVQEHMFQSDVDYLARLKAEG